MKEIILTSVLSLAFLFAAYNSLNKCIHMLQLSSYQYAGYFRTVFRIRSYFIPYFFICVFALPVAFFVKNYIASRIIVACIFVLWGLVRKPDKYAKKKLVYTKRVKRLIVTDTLLSLALIAAMFVWRDSKLSMIFATAFYALSVLVLALANLINLPVEKLINHYYISDAKRILKESGANVIGITGSYGKTSVKFYLSALLREKYDTLNTPSSFNTTLGVVRTIRESLSSTHEIFVCEMGARHVGDIKEICKVVHPDCGIITSIGEQHLETFHTLENIKKTKLELFDSVSKKGGKLFINADSVKDAKKLPYKNIITYGKDKACDYVASDVKMTKDGMEFCVTANGKESYVYTTRLLGSHNVLNLLGAIAVCHEYGIALEALALRVKRLKPVEHRQELRKISDGVIIDDAFNSNPQGAASALESLSGFDLTKILITPGMVELGSKEYELNCEFGKQAAKVCDYVFLVGKVHTESIYEGLKQEKFDMTRAFVASSFKDAMAQAMAIHTEKGRAILIENDLPDNY